MPDGSLLAQGLRADKAHSETDGEDRYSRHPGVSPGVTERFEVCRAAALDARWTGLAY